MTRITGGTTILMKITGNVPTAGVESSGGGGVMDIPVAVLSSMGGISLWVEIGLRVEIGLWVEISL